MKDDCADSASWYTFCLSHSTWKTNSNLWKSNLLEDVDLTKNSITIPRLKWLVHVFQNVYSYGRIIINESPHHALK